MTAGLIVSSVSVALLVAGCSKKAPDGADAAPAVAAAAVRKVSCADRGGGSVILFWKDCSDGINRTLGCDKKDDKVTCECLENEVVKKTFDATEHFKKDPTPLLPSHNPDAIVERHCGWALQR
jgi:hypothetical protein